MSGTEVKAALNDAVERLYVTFSSYPLSSPVTGCECCATPERDALLHAAPLRQLQSEHLFCYLGDGVLTLGTVTDFKHLLPRLMELTAIGRVFDFMEFPLLAAKFRYANWREWPIEEQRAVEHFFLCHWAHCVTIPSEAAFALDYLSAYAQSVDTLAPYLAVWQGASSPEAQRHLALAIVDSCAEWERFDAVATGGWWSSAQGNCAQDLKIWLTSDELLHRLESISPLLSDKKLSGELLVIAEWIRHWR